MYSIIVFEELVLLCNLVSLHHDWFVLVVIL